MTLVKQQNGSRNPNIWRNMIAYSTAPLKHWKILEHLMIYGCICCRWDAFYYAAPLPPLYRVQASFAIFRPQRSWVKSSSDPLPPLGIDKTWPGEVNSNRGLGNSKASIWSTHRSNTSRLRITLTRTPNSIRHVTCGKPPSRALCRTASRHVDKQPWHLPDKALFAYQAHQWQSTVAHCTQTHIRTIFAKICTCSNSKRGKQLKPCGCQHVI